MKIEDCKHILEWDYKGWINTNYPQNVEQIDWNQTLVTKMNQISALIFQSADRRGGANTIEFNSKLFKIIKTLEYYNEEYNTMSGRYRVVLNDDILDDYIFVYCECLDDEFESVNKDYINFINLAPLENVEYLNENKYCYHGEDIDTYRKSLRGCIKVLTY